MAIIIGCKSKLLPKFKIGLWWLIITKGEVYVKRPVAKMARTQTF